MQTRKAQKRINSDPGRLENLPLVARQVTASGQPAIWTSTRQIWAASSTAHGISCNDPLPLPGRVDVIFMSSSVCFQQKCDKNRTTPRTRKDTAPDWCKVGSTPKVIRKTQPNWCASLFWSPRSLTSQNSEQLHSISPFMDWTRWPGKSRNFWNESHTPPENIDYLMTSELQNKIEFTDFWRKIG